MAVEGVFRDHWGRVLATLVGMFRDIELAEDVAQEAFAIAAERWPRDGEPANPTAWLIATARNRAIDQIRRQQVLAEKTRLIAHELTQHLEPTMDEPATFRDERLELIFTCCHPALSREAQVALTLRTLGGLSTEEIARAFLTPFDTMSKRLTRAKHKIRDARIPFAVPEDHQLPDRLAAVLVIVYLIFNEGWSDGRVDLAAEAIRLGRASSRWTSRTGRCGTSSRSSRVASCSAGQSPGRAPGPTSSRPPSPTCTCSNPVTGTRSLRSTGRSPSAPDHRW